MRTYWVGICRVQVVIIDPSNSISITLRRIVKGCLEQSCDFRSNQMTKLFQSNNEASSDESTPVGIPAVVYFLRISCTSHSGLLWLLLIIAVPISRQNSDPVITFGKHSPLVLRVFILPLNHFRDNLQGIFDIFPLIPGQKSRRIPSRTSRFVSQR